MVNDRLLFTRLGRHQPRPIDCDGILILGRRSGEIATADIGLNCLA
jgi:hypothetical protein